MLGRINVSALSSPVRQFIFEYTKEHDPSERAGLHDWTLTDKNLLMKDKTVKFVVLILVNLQKSN